MKMYQSYIKERLGLDMILIDKIGFATYRILGQECYIIDIHVEKEHRQNGYAEKMGNEIQAIAKKAGCCFLTGTVDITTANPEYSMVQLIKFGFKFLNQGPDTLLYFRKYI